MARAVQQLKLDDFSGGLNLRRSEFTLGRAESPDMLNVEYAEGGVRTRRGWEAWNVGDITTPGVWNPRTAFIHERASGADTLVVGNAGDSKVHWSIDGTFQALTVNLFGGGTADLVASAGTHVADYAPWGDDLFFARGDARVVVWDGVSAAGTELADAPVDQPFVDDYTAPVGVDFAVRADFVAAHGGRLWVASTYESGVSHPHRIRWSHPNNPRQWASQDYLDIQVGGGPITGIVPMQDHLLVFKASAIFAIYGYDGESQQLINVSWTKGARSRQLITRSESACYFMSFPDGVFKIENSQTPQEVSTALRPMLQSGWFNKSAADEQWLGWLGNRLWWSVPYEENEVVTDAKCVFVLDDSVHGGSWTKFQSAAGYGLGPFAQGAYAQGSVELFGFLRSGPSVVKVDERPEATDNLTGAEEPFASRYTTRWMDAGYTDLKKRWKRPTFVSLDAGTGYRFQVSVRVDFEKAIVRRFGVNVDTASVGARYGESVHYGDGTEYASQYDEQMRLRKGSSLGTAASMQLQVDGEPGIPWGLGSVVFKYRARRMS